MSLKIYHPPNLTKPLSGRQPIFQEVLELARVHSRELQQIRGQIAVSQQEPNSYSAYFRTQQELLRRFAAFSGTGELTQPIYVPGLDAVTEIAKQYDDSGNPIG